MLSFAVYGPYGDKSVYRVITGVQSYMGPFEPKDRVIQVCILEPTLLGSSLYHLSEKVFPVFIGDVRYAIISTDLTVDENTQARVRHSSS